jgi:hypothetical protein
MNLNKICKIISISLVSIAFLGVLIYGVLASNKDCLACTLPTCEMVNEQTGEKYLGSAEDCAKTYEEMQQMKQDIAIGASSECSKECISYASGLVTFSIVMTLLAAFLIVAFVVYQLIVRPENIKGMAIGVGAMLILFFISYLLSSSEIPEIIGYTAEITKFEIVMADTLLYMTYLLLGGAVLGVMLSNINKFRK